MAVVAAGTLSSVALLSGCSTFDGPVNCNDSLGIGRHAVVVGAGIPTGAVAQVCDPDGCASATGSRTGQIEVPLPAKMPEKTTEAITATVSAGGSAIAAPVTATATATPSAVTQNGCANLVDYRFTVTVSPTR